MLDHKLSLASSGLDGEALNCNIVIETLEYMETPQVGSVKSVEVEELIQEPSSITEDQLFDELPHTVVRCDTHDLNAIVHEGGHSATIVVKMCDDSYCGNSTLQTKVPTVVLEDTNESNIEEAENSLDNVVWFGKSPQRDTSGFLVPFAGQQTIMSEANERNVPGFLLSKSREHAIEGKLRRVLGEIAESYSKQSPDIRVNKVVKLLFAMFGLVHKSRTTSPYIVFNPGPYLDWGAFPFDDVLNHLLVSLCVQTVQPRLPCPLPKPPFPALLLEFLAQVAQYVEISKELDFDGLVIIIEDDSNTNAHLVAAHFSIKLQPAEAFHCCHVTGVESIRSKRSEYKVMLQVVHPTGYTFYAVIEMVELAARHRLRHGLVARKRFGGERASKTIHQYFKVDNFSFDGSEHITGEGIDATEEWREKGINSDHISHIRELLLESLTNIPHVAASNASKLKIMIYESLSDTLEAKQE
ncbi:hypothetical protein K7X08_036116 [Anisodus acutangulus]|uniref:Uncharacterized protein n=1 Tax=Anisodus acutangulus TaxID=402998 RepID=A0A9Q1L812_9SOLA|nr:hypothetical protein K7X08_036116 [Anisodus acutangulus]